MTRSRRRLAAARPRAAERAGRHARAEQQSPVGAWPGLIELLSGHHAEGEPGIDEFIGQLFRGEHTTLDDGVEPNLLDVTHASFKVGEDPALEQVGDLDGVTEPAQLVRECEDARSASECVVKQEHVSIVAPTRRSSHADGVVEPEHDRQRAKLRCPPRAGQLTYTR